MPAKKRKKKSESPALPKKLSNKKFAIRSKHSSGDLVEIQLSATLKRVPKGVKITGKLLAEMVKHKAETSVGRWTGRKAAGCREGKNPPGIELKITRWRNPSRKGKLRQWRTGSQAEAWGTLRRITERARIKVG